MCFLRLLMVSASFLPDLVRSSQTYKDKRMEQGLIEPHSRRSFLSSRAIFPGPKDSLCAVSPSSSGGGNYTILVSISDHMRSVQFGDENAIEGSVYCGAGMRGCKSGVLGPISDAANCPDCPCVKLELDQEVQKSQREMIEFVTPLCRAASSERPLNVLNFGLGVGVTHSFLRELCPRGTLHMRSVEYDARMKTLGEKYLGLSLVEGQSEVIIDDASHFAQKEVEQGVSSQYDVIMSDCFIGNGRQPKGVLTKTFLNDLKVLLRPGGAVLHHIWHESPGFPDVQQSFEAIMPVYAELFGAARVSYHEIKRPANQFDGFITAKKE